MPFSITCPSCDATLTAPDAAEGKRVKCKKCGDPFVARRDTDVAPPEQPARAVRDDDDEEEAPRSKRSTRPADDDDGSDDQPPLRRGRSREEDEDEAPRRGLSKARRPADDDDLDFDRPATRDDDEDEDGPKPKRRQSKRGGRKGKKSGAPVLLFVLLGIGALVVLGGCAGAVAYLVNEAGGGSYKEKVVGTWEWNVGIGTVIVTINRDGTGTLRGPGGETKIKWRIQRGNNFVINEGGKDSGFLIDSADENTIRGTDPSAPGIPIVWKRKK